MTRTILSIGVFVGCALGQTPDDGATDSTAAIQRALDTGHLRLAGDPLGTGARITAIIADGRVAEFRIDSPGARYCKPPAIRVSGNAGGVAQVDADCRLTAVRVVNAGSGYTTVPQVYVVPKPRCYGVTQLRVPAGALFEGDGSSTCMVAGDPSKPAIFSEGAYGFHLRDFALEGRGAADTGMQFNGGDTGDAALCTLENVTVSGFRQKNIELNKSYGFVFQNVNSSGSDGWGLYLRDGYNNATQIISGEYSGNKIGGVYVGAHSIQFRFSSIAESNGKYGIFYKGPAMGIQIDDAYFEANGDKGTGWDVYGEFVDYDFPTRGLSIRNTLFNSAASEGAALLQNTVDVDLSHNTGMPPIMGDPFSVNAIRIGKGTANLRLDGNTGLAIRNTAGTPIHTAAPPFTTDLFTQAWPLRLALPPASGAANMTTVTRSVRVSSGHMVGAGLWLRTDSGTATAWIEISDASAVYTGSVVNQPLRQSIGTDWEWIGTNVATDIQASLKATGVRLRVYRNDGSDTTAVYLRAPQAWRDIAGTPARSTIQSFSATGSETRRSRTSEGHSATLPSKP